MQSRYLRIGHLVSGSSPGALYCVAYHSGRAKSTSPGVSDLELDQPFAALFKELDGDLNAWHPYGAPGPYWGRDTGEPHPLEVGRENRLSRAGPGEQGPWSGASCTAFLWRGGTAAPRSTALSLAALADGGVWRAPAAPGRTSRRRPARRVTGSGSGQGSPVWSSPPGSTGDFGRRRQPAATVPALSGGPLGVRRQGAGTARSTRRTSARPCPSTSRRTSAP
jgi:hypothetical protein